MTGSRRVHDEPHDPRARHVRCGNKGGGHEHAPTIARKKKKASWRPEFKEARKGAADLLESLFV